MSSNRASSRPDHPAQALLAAQEIPASFRKHDQVLRNIRLPDTEIGIGIGIDCGVTNFGEFGTSHRGLTAIAAALRLRRREARYW